MQAVGSFAQESKSKVQKQNLRKRCNQQPQGDQNAETADVHHPALQRIQQPLGLAFVNQT